MLFAPVGGIDRRVAGPQAATGGAGGRLRGDVLRVGAVAIDPRHAFAHHLEIHILAVEPHYAEDASVHVVSIACDAHLPAADERLETRGRFGAEAWKPGTGPVFFWPYKSSATTRYCDTSGQRLQRGFVAAFRRAARVALALGRGERGDRSGLEPAVVANLSITASPTSTSAGR